MLTQTKPFSPPAVGTAFPTVFATFAEPAAIPNAGVPQVAVVLEALERFLLVQPVFDGAGVGATADGGWDCVAAGVVFL